MDELEFEVEETETGVQAGKRRRKSALRQAIDLRDQIQKNRIGLSNQLSSIDRGVDDAPPEGIQDQTLSDVYAALVRIENDLNLYVAELVAEHPFYEIITEVPGVGPISAAKLIALIDIHNTPTVSALWRWAGYGVIPNPKGEGMIRERPVKGGGIFKPNRRLKKACYILGSGLLRVKNPYRPVYDNAVAYYQRTHGPDSEVPWTKAHIHYASLGKVIKLFLSHLWVTWRAFENLPVDSPYALARQPDMPEHLHTVYFPPEDFGWPVVTGAVIRPEESLV